MDTQRMFRDLDEERVLVERDLAVGDWPRARRRAGYALNRLVSYLRPIEPELWEWFRILGTLAQADLPSRSDGQMVIWPDMSAGRAGSATPETAARSCPSGVGLGASRSVPARMRILTRDRRMLRALILLEQLAATELPMLLEGESGTGKEVVAHGVHASSPRSEQAFVPVNCGAIPSELHESELFGHTRGAYTGATVEKAGLFEAAHRGTLFLDEIGEMEPRAQVKLLRVLEAGEIRRLGEVRTRRVNVRIVAATNHNVDEAVTAGRFRKDLLFRLGAVRVTLPPLRERRCDILPLALHFLRKASTQVPPLTPAAQTALLKHDWPGNVRELKFVMERTAALWERGTATALTRELLHLHGLDESCDQDRVGPEAADELLWDETNARTETSLGLAGWDGELPEGRSLETFLGEIEKRLIWRALEGTGGNRTLAARALGGLSRTTLIGKMKRLGLFEPIGATCGSPPRC